MKRHRRTNKIVALGKIFHSTFQYCTICGGSPVDMAHLVGRNVSYKKNGIEQNDPTKLEAVVPLCRKHHMQYDKNTSLDARIEFWHKNGCSTIANKMEYKFKN